MRSLASGRQPDFAEMIIFDCEMEFALSAENVYRQGVEEFVGEDDEWNLGREGAAQTVRLTLRMAIFNNSGLARCHVLAKGILQFREQRGRRFLQRESQGIEEIGEFLFRPIEHVAGEEATPGAKFDNFDLTRTIERLPHLFKLPRQQTSEDSVDVAGSVEVSGLTELLGMA